MLPWRARPVPFCFHGFLPPPETSLRPFVSCVPARRSASSRTTAWWSSGTRISTPKTSALSSTAPVSLPFASTTFTLGITSSPRPSAAAPWGLDALAHHHQRAVGPGHGAADQDQVLLGQHPRDGDVERGALHAAHATRQLVARPHARGIRGGADGAGRAMEHRAVRRLAAAPAVALDTAL